MGPLLRLSRCVAGASSAHPHGAIAVMLTLPQHLPTPQQKVLQRVVLLPLDLLIFLLRMEGLGVLFMVDPFGESGAQQWKEFDCEKLKSLVRWVLCRSKPLHVVT